jgi:Rrf2 family nitric oxide-sensitive transcriptional repressor
MRLTTYTDYSLRTLMYLALKPDGLATIGEIAEAYGISGNHLMKVVHQLGLAGDVETVRGRQGGVRLARRPEDINIGKLVRRIEPDGNMAPCDENVGNCPLTPVCVLHSALGKAIEAFYSVLDGYSLADLTRPGQQLRSLLGFGLPAAAGPAA